MRIRNRLLCPLILLIILTLFSWAIAEEILPGVKRGNFSRNGTVYSIEKVCMDGFVFYASSSGNTFTLLYKLDKDGKPVPCTSGKRVCLEKAFLGCRRWKWIRR